MTEREGCRIVPTGCAHNCGGHCVLNAWVRDGRIVRLTTDERPDRDHDLQLRACPRGRAYLRRVYHPDRLLHPLIRVGARGEGRFVRASWTEAIDRVARAMQDVMARHGPAAFLNMHGTGAVSLLAGSPMSERLLNVFGGQLNHYNTYSSAAARWATPFSLGTDECGHSPDDWLHARLILLWGFNPAETVFGTNTSYHLRRARRAGARIVVIDPRFSLTAQALADEWIPIRPGTDNALMDAMAFVMIAEGLHDRAFLDRYTVGFDEAHLPAGAPAGSSYEHYVLGRGDGVPKTPDWAAPITQIPADRIVGLARAYAGTKPAALLSGLAFNRRAYGEQPVRGTITLAAMTGNIGVSGGSPGGVTYSVARRLPVREFPRGANAIPEAIPVFLWTDSIVRGTAMGAADGVIDLPPGQTTLRSRVRFLFNTAGNTLINQHANVNRTAAILRDEALVDFIVVVDQFLTPSARFADVVLPAVTWLERNDVGVVWGHGDSITFMNQAIEPIGECRSDYEICAMLADRLGVGRAFTEGRSELEWLETLLEPARAADSTFPSFDEFRRRGLHLFRYAEPHVAFREFRADPDRHPLATPSGRIEIYSTRLAAMRIEHLPAIPTYIPEWEGGPWDPLFAKYPLQAFGRHYQRRTHSIYDNVDWLEESMPQRLFMNPIDAEPRGIEDGDVVRVHNDRGEVRVPVRLSRRLVPGLVELPQGAWWTPDAHGIDRRGNINVLTSERATPGARGNAQHTVLVEVERVGGPPRSTPVVARDSGGATADRRAERSERAPRAVVGGEPRAPLGFHVDVSACSGCKACQLACKDAHGLGTGRLWRRVIEVERGEWRREGQAWRPAVTAYSVSVSCMHCAEPACLAQCPTGAITRQDDGVVIVDGQVCIGCRYCSWVCPYGAPQFDDRTGTMSKCDLCRGEREAGRSPVCVAACPLRALDWGPIEELRARHGHLQSVPPLPDGDATGPSVVFTASPAVTAEGRPTIVNGEEIGR